MAVKRAAVRAGDRAPAFRAPLQDGTTFDLADRLGRTALVLFFYPKDDTPICTAEACAFRDAYEEFIALGADVVGVSSDSAASHAAFARKHRLPFPIVSDTDGAVRRLYGVPRTLGLLPGRVTYVIDREGIVRLVFNAALSSSGHVRRALDALR